MSKNDKIKRWEPSARWVRVKLGDEIVADSKRAILVWEGTYFINYYFPPEDVRRDLLEPTGRSGRGRETWHVNGGRKVAENAAWSYTDLAPENEALAGYITFRWSKMDAWYEEEEEIFVHPRDPYHRVDVIPSSRHIKVEVNGEVVAESKRPYLLFETGMPTRYYLPQEDVHMDLLAATKTQTSCPYKGVASYWAVQANGDSVKDIVWGYLNPIQEAGKLKDLLSFYNEKVTIYVDGELENQPQTAWS